MTVGELIAKLGEYPPETPVAYLRSDHEDDGTEWVSLDAVDLEIRRMKTGAGGRYIVVTENSPYKDYMAAAETLAIS
jgi:hypothetical protein